MGSRGVGLIVGPHLQYLDHMLPLCELFSLPLVVTHSDVYALAQAKGVDTDLDPTLSGELIKKMECLFYVEPAKVLKDLFKWEGIHLHKKALSFFSWHGNSNKYRTEFWAERAAFEDTLLYYGPFMRDYYQEKGVWNRIKYKIHVGNYRRLIQKRLQLPKTSQKKILYAPTWSFRGKVEASPFLDLEQRLLKRIPKECLLIIKPHPYYFFFFPKEINQMLNRYANHENILFLSQKNSAASYFEEVDAFLGDYSSVGYDFLSTGKPLYFLPGKEKDPHLFPCGVTVTEDTFFHTLSKPFPKKCLERGKKLYMYCFGESQPTKEKMLQEIDEVIQCAR